jgi:hypothetical protein
MVSPEALPLLPRPSGSFIDSTNGWWHSLDRFALFDTFCRIFHPQEHGFNDPHQTNHLVAYLLFTPLRADLVRRPMLSKV